MTPLAYLTLACSLAATVTVLVLAAGAVLSYLGTQAGRRRR